MNRQRTLATLGIALAPLLFVFTGGFQNHQTGQGVNNVPVASTVNALSSAQEQLAACQAALTARNPRLSSAGRDWANHCIEVESAAIRVLSATPTPTPSGSPTPSPTTTSTNPTPTPTTTSPSPSPTATTPSPTPTTSSPSPTPTTPSPTPTTPSPTPTTGAWPGPDNTGPGTATLLPWSGCPADGSPAAITTPNLHLNQMIINCDVRVLTSGLVITFSKINGSINDEETDTRSFTITDSEIDAGINHNAAVWHTNLTALRDNIHGGITAVSCVDLCHVEDSWLHGQRHDPNATGQHYGGFLSNGGGDVNHQSLIRHNTIVCDADQVDPGLGDDKISSCSGDTNLFGDFGPVSYYIFDNNLLGAGTATGHPSLCAYGGSGKTFDPDHITYTNNVFERGPFGTCGFFGPVGNWDPTRPGMVWTNNRYEDGELITP